MEIQTANNVAENFVFNFRICKTFSYLLSFANFSSTKSIFAFGSFSSTKYFQCFVVQCLNRLNTLSPYQKFVQIRNDRGGFWLYLAKLCSRDKHYTTIELIKVPSLKVGVYLILDVHNTLLTDST